MNSHREVCYGAVRAPDVFFQGNSKISTAKILLSLQIYDILAKPVRHTTILKDTASAQTVNSYAYFHLRHTDGVVEVCSDDGVEFAILDSQSTCQLQCLERVAGTRSEAVVELRDIAKRKPKSRKPISLTVNIFGPREAADKVSLAVSRNNGFLQHPRALDSNIDYYNPDMLVFPGDDLAIRDYIGAGTPSWKHDCLIKDIEKIMVSLGQDTGLQGDQLYPIGGLKSALTKFVNHRIKQLQQDTTHADGRQASRERFALYTNARRYDS